MIEPSLDEFRAAYECGRAVVVRKTILADMETPVSVLARIADREEVFLLESCEHGEAFGRYSFLGFNPRGRFTIERGVPYFEAAGKKRVLPFDTTPLDALKALIRSEPVEVEGLPPLLGGAVGYMGYDCVRLFETLPEPKHEVGADDSLPDALFLVTDDIMAFDNMRHTLSFITVVHPVDNASADAAYLAACERLAVLEAPLHQPLPTSIHVATHEPKVESNMSRAEFCAMVEKARDAIQQGECIQVVLSQRFTAQTDLSPLQIYRALRHVNPSPYTFFIKVGTLALIGSSPETLVKLEKGKTSVRPIAGTRPRGATPTQDRANADELLRDEKERAEHLMLVDLGRNDLGRTAELGSVKVSHFMHIERYSHVMHLVSDVDALLRADCSPYDLVRTTFPAGTLSGAPKIRAMELIHELEPTPRGTYGGAVGYFSNTGDLDLAITIRTCCLRGQQLTIQAGAGIVYDSDPEREYEETCNKAAALFKALHVANTL